MELYVHIPFCVRKCGYCDFLSFAADEAVQRDYIDALRAELKALDQVRSCKKACADAPSAHDANHAAFTTCFIGGGTPSIVPVSLMERLLDGIAALGVSGEYTIECNPGTLDESKLKIYKKYGINRLSIGLQSADDRELKRLGRIHDFDEFLNSYRMARACGFDNINIDLMSGLPGQSTESFERTLRSAAELEPEHLSVYSLIIEENTPFYELYGGEGGDKAVKADHECEGRPSCAKSEETNAQLPDEDTEREMYRMTASVLEEYGFSRYEISNYAKAGFECRHNLGYWTGEEYEGAGIGAASYLKTQTGIKTGQGGKSEICALRYRNTTDINTYVHAFAESASSARDAVRTVEEELAADDMIQEYIILHLRLIKGILRTDFTERFGFDIYEGYGRIIDKYLRSGHMETNGGYLRLTRRGLDVSNSIMADFMCEPISGCK